MAIYNIHEAKTHFSSIIQSVLAGEEIVIAKSGKPLVSIIPYSEKTKKKKRELGFLKGKGWVSEDFNSPLPPEMQKLFEG